MTADEWNARYPIGTQVLYRPYVNDPRAVQATTRSEAWKLDCLDPVVLITGHTGGVWLKSLAVLSPPEPNEACAAYTARDG